MSQNILVLFLVVVVVFIYLLAIFIRLTGGLFLSRSFSEWKTAIADKKTNLREREIGLKMSTFVLKYFPLLFVLLLIVWKFQWYSGLSLLFLLLILLIYYTYKKHR
ncbi:MAG: hypothetical protein LBM95_08915 [Lactobacillales bacterium]|jgi:hypothetical protein|nr:hypothetical protein [Lactobacillales bacterium]